jgi:hypothetical protein
LRSVKESSFPLRLDWELLEDVYEDRRDYFNLEKQVGTQPSKQIDGAVPEGAIRARLCNIRFGNSAGANGPKAFPYTFRI